jgi:hypothetical protein
MSEQVKCGLIIGAAIIFSALALVYFSQYNSCMRLAPEKDLYYAISCVAN